MDPVTLPVMVAITIVSLAVSGGIAWGIVRHQSARSEERIDVLERDLAAFKIEAARKFVTDDMLVRLEERIVDSINRLGDRLDRILERPAGRRS